MRARILLLVASLLPVGLATTAFWHASAWAPPFHVAPAPADVTLVVGRPVSSAQAPPTLVPARGAAPTPLADTTAVPTPAPATPTESVVATATPTAVADTSTALAAPTAAPRQSSPQLASLTAAYSKPTPSAITDRAPAPVVREAARTKPRNVSVAPPGQVKNKAKAHRD